MYEFIPYAFLFVMFLTFYAFTKTTEFRKFSDDLLLRIRKLKSESFDFLISIYYLLNGRVYSVSIPKNIIIPICFPDGDNEVVYGVNNASGFVNRREFAFSGKGSNDEFKDAQNSEPFSFSIEPTMTRVFDVIKGGTRVSPVISFDLSKTLC